VSGFAVQATNSTDAVKAQLDALHAQVLASLKNADPSLAAEFAKIVRTDGGMFTAEAQAAALVGWKKGVVAAELFEAKMKAEAEAYAEARVKEERRVGFSGSPGGAAGPEG